MILYIHTMIDNLFFRFKALGKYHEISWFYDVLWMICIYNNMMLYGGIYVNQLLGK